MKLKNKLKSEKGFSLIELMVVVAIIGILSAIAVPNFIKFQAKSKRSEAKALLSGYYTAAQASRAEFGYYSGNFIAIGFALSGTLNYRLRSMDGANPPPGHANDNLFIGSWRNSTRVGFRRGATASTPNTDFTENLVSARTPSVACTTTTNATFRTCAASALSSSSAVADTWQINESKNLVLVLDGL